MIQNSDLSQFHSISDQIQMHCKKLLYLTHMDSGAFSWLVQFIGAGVKLNWNNQTETVAKVDLSPLPSMMIQKWFWTNPSSDCELIRICSLQAVYLLYVYHFYINFSD